MTTPSTNQAGDATSTPSDTTNPLNLYVWEFDDTAPRSQTREQAHANLTADEIASLKLLDDQTKGLINLALVTAKYLPRSSNWMETFVKVVNSGVLGRHVLSVEVRLSFRSAANVLAPLIDDCEASLELKNQCREACDLVNQTVLTLPDGTVLHPRQNVSTPEAASSATVQNTASSTTTTSAPPVEQPANITNPTNDTNIADPSPNQKRYQATVKTEEEEMEAMEGIE